MWARFVVWLASLISAHVLARAAVSDDVDEAWWREQEEADSNRFSPSPDEQE